MNILWILPIIILLIGAVIIAILGRFAKEETFAWQLTYGIISIVSFLAALGVLIFTYGSVGSIPESELYWKFGANIGTVFKLDALTWWLNLVFLILGSTVAIYSIRYMDHDDRLDRYYLLLLTLVAGMIGVVMSGDMITLFIFWETMSISSYVLVAFRKNSKEPIEAGIKYLFMSAFGSISILFSMSLLYGLTGTLNIAGIGAAISTQIAANGLSPVYYVIIATLILGFGVKAAIVPLHLWLPDAHPAAPSGISAMLSGVVIMTGMYGMIYTLVSFFGLPSLNNVGYVLLWISIATMIIGNFLALRQTDVKRLLAFSTVLNVGFILFGLSMLLTDIDTEAILLGAQGGLYHIFTHSLGKGLAFLCAGAILYRFEERNLEKLEGIGQKMPWTMSAFTVALLSLGGVPPLPGFWSKLNIVVAAVNSGDWQYYIGIALFLLSSVISVVYYLLVLQRLWFNEPQEHLAEVTETPASILIPLYVIVGIMLLVGILPNTFSTLARDAADILLNL
jgi:proton-translocating NADH-quinone oxidoreductase chain N